MLRRRAPSTSATSRTSGSGALRSMKVEHVDKQWANLDEVRHLSLQLADHCLRLDFTQQLLQPDDDPAQPGGADLGAFGQIP